HRGERAPQAEDALVHEGDEQEYERKCGELDERLLIAQPPRIAQDTLDIFGRQERAEQHDVAHMPHVDRRLEKQPGPDHRPDRRWSPPCLLEDRFHASTVDPVSPEHEIPAAAGVRLACRCARYVGPFGLGIACSGPYVSYSGGGGRMRLGLSVTVVLLCAA